MSPVLLDSPSASTHTLYDPPRSPNLLRKFKKKVIAPGVIRVKARYRRYKQEGNPNSDGREYQRVRGYICCDCELDWKCGPHEVPPMDMDEKEMFAGRVCEDCVWIQESQMPLLDLRARDFTPIVPHTKCDRCFVTYEEIPIDGKLCPTQ